jgi:hypothetical protein
MRSRKNRRAAREPRIDVEVIARRLKVARQDYAARHGKSER